MTGLSGDVALPAIASSRGMTVQVLEFALPTFSRPIVWATRRMPTSKKKRFSETRRQHLFNGYLFDMGTLLTVEISGLDQLQHPLCEPTHFCGVSRGNFRTPRANQQNDSCFLRLRLTIETNTSIAGTSQIDVALSFLNRRRRNIFCMLHPIRTGAPA